MNNEQHFEMAASIYLALINNKIIIGKREGQTEFRLFEDDISAQNAEIVIADYFKLVNKL